MEEPCGIYDTSFLSFMKRGVREGRPRILRSVFRPRSTTHSVVEMLVEVLFQSSFHPAKFTSLSSQTEKIITVGAKCFRCAEVLFQLPDGNIIIVGAKRFRCLGQCEDTPRSVLSLSIGSGARVLVARSIFTVSAKRFRYAEVLFLPGHSAT